MLKFKDPNFEIVNSKLLEEMTKKTEKEKKNYKNFKFMYFFLIL